MRRDDAARAGRKGRGQAPPSGYALAWLLLACAPVLMAWMRMDLWDLWMLTWSFCR